MLFRSIFWNNDAPQFFTLEDMKKNDFNISVIADVTCDIAPVSSVPSTLFASTIAEPVFGYNPKTMQAEAPFQPNVIDVMSIDNLPNELPRDASEFFGKQFIENILSDLLHIENSGVIQGATICSEGKLTALFEYLSDYAS